jgi:cytochrome c oxidase subunit 1
MEATTLKDSFMDKTRSKLGVTPEDSRLSLTYLSLAFIILFVGGFLGLVQGLNRAGLFELPPWFDYYQVLTSHGILLVLVFTTLFMTGYFYAGVSHMHGGLSPKVRKMGWTAFGVMVFGVVMTVATVIAGNASVMYTFYPPMQASPWFYVGLTIVVVGIWIAAAGIWTAAVQWKKQNKGKHLPLFTYFAVGAYLLLFLGSLGVTAEMAMLIPWAFGWVETVNVMLSRTLFWAFGHTAVNVWYLVAVSAWYVAVPTIIGGKLFSDTLARVVVILSVVLNVPGGFHHQIIDPAITEGVKFMHVFMSLSISLPSLLTAFAMFAVFAKVGKSKGAKGIFGFLKKLPWTDVRFLAPMIAMITFIPAGAGGIAQTNHHLNQTVHNSLWVVGHFHLTVGVTVALTFFGITYWLLPYLTKRTLTPRLNKLGLIQTWIWTIGMLLMSGAMHWVGLLGSPRRTSFSTYGDSATALGWDPYLFFLAIGGTLLFIGVALMVYIAYQLAFRAPKGETEFPVAEPEKNAAPTPKWTERWGLWIVVAFAVISMGYVIPIVEMIVNAPPGSPPFQPW